MKELEINQSNIDFVSINLEKEAELFLRAYLKEYINQGSEKSIASGQTMLLGSWLIKFEQTGNTFDVYELSDESLGVYKNGIGFSLNLINSQRELCLKNNLAFTPVSCDKLVAAYDDIFDSNAYVYGLKDIGTDKMSGFVLWSDYSPKDISKIRYYHLYDLTKKLPKIFKFLAIPEGYKFNLNTEEIIQSNINENS